MFKQANICLQNCDDYEATHNRDRSRRATRLHEIQIQNRFDLLKYTHISLSSITLHTYGNIYDSSQSILSRFRQCTVTTKETQLQHIIDWITNQGSFSENGAKYSSSSSTLLSGGCKPIFIWWLSTQAFFHVKRKQNFPFSNTGSSMPPWMMKVHDASMHLVP